MSGSRKRKRRDSDDEPDDLEPTNDLSGDYDPQDDDDEDADNPDPYQSEDDDLSASDVKEMVDDGDYDPSYLNRHASAEAMRGAATAYVKAGDMDSARELESVSDDPLTISTDDVEKETKKAIREDRVDDVETLQKLGVKTKKFSKLAITSDASGEMMVALGVAPTKKKCQTRCQSKRICCIRSFLR